MNADLKPLCIELYVRGAAVDLNDLENRKLRGDVDMVKSGEMALASTFSALADVVDANVRICRECVLTAFSLHPTKQRFERLTQLAAAPVKGDAAAAAADTVVVEHSRGAVVGEPPPGGGDDAVGAVGGPFHLAFASVKKEREESEFISGAQHSASSVNNNRSPLSLKENEDADSGVDVSDAAVGTSGVRQLNANALEGEVKEEVQTTSPYSGAAALSLGVSRQIVNDLAVVLHSCRWEILNWNMGWSRLRPLCEQYLDNKDRMRSVTKELKYLKVIHSFQFNSILSDSIQYYLIQLHLLG